jgi:hypothetical protein
MQQTRNTGGIAAARGCARGARRRAPTTVCGRRGGCPHRRSAGCTTGLPAWTTRSVRELRAWGDKGGQQNRGKQPLTTGCSPDWRYPSRRQAVCELPVSTRAAHSGAAAVPVGQCPSLLMLTARSLHGRPQLTEGPGRAPHWRGSVLNSLLRAKVELMKTYTDPALRQGRIARHNQGAAERTQTSARTSPWTAPRSAARALVGGRTCSAAAAAAASAGAAAATGGAAGAAASAAGAAAGAAGWTMGRRTPWWRPACLSTRARARLCASSPSRRCASAGGRARLCWQPHLSVRAEVERGESDEEHRNAPS